MARPPLTIGTWGTITTTTRGTRRVAKARFRDYDGRTRLVEASGRSAAEAERRLKARLIERAAPSDADITADSRVSVLLTYWAREIEESDLAPDTKRLYLGTLRREITPALGNLVIREVTVARVEAFLRAVKATKTVHVARTAQKVLSSVWAVAARLGATDRNIVKDTSPVAVPAKAVQALTAQDVRAIRDGLRTDKKARAADLPDVVDMFAATGLRISEVLGVRWDDVDLDAGTVTPRMRVQRIKGQGLHLTDRLKTKGKRATLQLPSFALDMLLRRRIEQSAPNPHNVVFPSLRGTLRDVSNMERQWRDARTRLGYGWVTPHTFRKTVATIVANALDARAAASQLGHTTSATTERHYIERSVTGPDARAQLQALAGGDSDSNSLG
ncbi:tyrosine-type recombinase/integrase [Cumulibacter soli]|uniref:tyrosine-type recombinase/integrase n=1 Tax=Cumulibacter soli TaxID=2546344 RepID=UPI00141A5F1E|nr:tyrosine-type recombinase/integrase [Cumulibacter soli]